MREPVVAGVSGGVGARTVAVALAGLTAPFVDGPDLAAAPRTGAVADRGAGSSGRTPAPRR